MMILFVKSPQNNIVTIVTRPGVIGLMLNVEYYLRHYLEVVGVLLEAVNLLSERQEDVVLSGGQELHLALHDGL